MVCILLAKRIISTPRLPRLFSSSIDPKIPHFSVIDYLISSFGFSPDKAAKVSKSISHIKSSDKPDAVRCFLSHHGFTEADIKRLITWRPRMFCASPENTLATNLVALRDIGLSTSGLNQIILSNPQALHSHSAVPRINFWKDFLGGDETALVKAFKQNRNLANHDIDQTISPNLSLLRNHGLSNEYIPKIVLQVPIFITMRISWVEDCILRAKALGFQPGSGMFLAALDAMRAVTREDLQRKQEFFMSFGWSEDNFLKAVQKDTAFLKQGEKALQAKMDFLTREARCDPSYIASRPMLLHYSLEKRLRPRLHILHLLESKGLTNKVRRFYSVIELPNKKFAEKYVLPRKQDISELSETFVAACA